MTTTTCDTATDGQTAAAPPEVLPFQQAKAEALQRFERDYLTAVMAQANGNVTRAALLAGKERRAFGKLLKKHGLSGSAAGAGDEDEPAA